MGGDGSGTKVPGNVKFFYNWYQSKGDGPESKDGHHGMALSFDAPGYTVPFQHDYNQTGEEMTNSFPEPGSGDEPINHNTIIWHVERELIEALN